MELTDHSKIRTRFFIQAYDKHPLGPMGPAAAILEIAQELQAQYYADDCETMEFDLPEELMSEIVNKAEDKDYTFSEMITEILQLQLQNEVQE